MSDTTPEPREGAASGPGSGARRSGLDRLRAAQGGSASETPPSAGAVSSGASPSTAAGATASGSTASSGTGDHPRRAGEGTTALLDSPAEGATAAPLAPE